MNEAKHSLRGIITFANNMHEHVPPAESETFRKVLQKSCDDFRSDDGDALKAGLCVSSAEIADCLKKGLQPAVRERVHAVIAYYESETGVGQ